MELAEKYAYKIWETQSFSEAAKALFISQPSLSATIARLEKSIGFRIFDRSTIPLSLTPQGRIYMDFLEESMASESNMRQRIQAMGKDTTESLAIGGQIFAALYLFPRICSALSRANPEIGVTIDMGGTGSMNVLLEKLKKGMLDLVLSYDFDPKVFEGIPLLEEQLVLVMRKDMAGADSLAPFAVSREEILRKSYPKDKEIEDVSLFRSIRFVKNRSPANTTQRMDEIFGSYDIAPYIVINVKQIEIFYNLMLSGVGAVMVSDFLIRQRPECGEDLLYFALKSPLAHRILYLIKKRDTPLRAPSEKVVSIAKELCASLPHEPF